MAHQLWCDPQHVAKGWYMYDLGCPSDFTVDMHIITMVRIRLRLLGIISAMLGLRMLQLLCRLPIKLHSYYMRINVRFEILAIAFEHIILRHNKSGNYCHKNSGDGINSKFERDNWSGHWYEVFSYWFLSYVLLRLHILTF